MGGRVEQRIRDTLAWDLCFIRSPLSVAFNNLFSFLFCLLTKSGCGDVVGPPIG